MEAILVITMREVRAIIAADRLLASASLVPKCLQIDVLSQSFGAPVQPCPFLESHYRPQLPSGVAKAALQIAPPALNHIRIQDALAVQRGVIPARAQASRRRSRQ